MKLPTSSDSAHGTTSRPLTATPSTGCAFPGVLLVLQHLRSSVVSSLLTPSCSEIAQADVDCSMDSDSSTLKLFDQFDDNALSETVVAVVVLLARRAGRKESGTSDQRHPNVQRGALEAGARLVRDYFGGEPVYSEETFRRRIRLRWILYKRIVSAVEGHDVYFQQRSDATRKLGLTALQNCTASIRHLAYGMAADAVDEYVRIGESTAVKSPKRFCAAVIALFGVEYLRKPTESDVQRLLAMHEER